MEPLLTQLQTALAEIVRSTIAYDRRGQVKSSILIRVNVSADGASAQRADSGQNKSPPGWGFFFIERMAEVVRDADRTSHLMIELYLYQERGESLLKLPA